MRFVLPLLLLIAPAYGAIRVYNPDTGTTEAAPSLESGDILTAPTITTAPKVKPRRQVQPILLPEEEEAAELANKKYPLGEVIFFVDFRRYIPVVGELIQQLEDISSLKVDAYMESKDPKEYARDILMMQASEAIKAEQDAQKMAKLPALVADKKNRAFTYHRPGAWHKAVYYDSTGSKRVYDIAHDMDKLKRHINRQSKARRK